MEMAMKTVLFLCTGNYYRSRFAEELFNHLGRRDGLAWRAESRALAIERGTDNVGPISMLALAALDQRGCAPLAAERMPQACTREDVARADLVVALKDSEHRPLMRARFPEHERRTAYWFVDDVDVTPADEALATIAREVEALVERLRREV
jgi:protein-tyrosine phosphatase